VVDGCSNEQQSIADTFASVFKSVCQPNSQVRHEQFKSVRFLVNCINIIFKILSLVFSILVCVCLFFLLLTVYL